MLSPRCGLVLDLMRTGLSLGLVDDMASVSIQFGLKSSTQHLKTCMPVASLCISKFSTCWKSAI